MFYDKFCENETHFMSLKFETYFYCFWWKRMYKKYFICEKLVQTIVRR